MPAAGEGDLHMVRQDIISNKSLLHCANELNLPTSILSKPFVAKVWEPVVQQEPGAQQAPSEPPTPTKSTEDDGEPPVRVLDRYTEYSVKLTVMCSLRSVARSRSRRTSKISNG